MVLDSSDTIFFPVKTFLRFFLTSLLRITWKKKMKMPCEVKRETLRVRQCGKSWWEIYIRCTTCRQLQTANR